MSVNPMNLVLTSITIYTNWTDERAEQATKTLILKIANDLDEGYEPSSITDDEITKFNLIMDEIERDDDDSDNDSDSDEEDEDKLRDLGEDEDDA